MICSNKYEFRGMELPCGKCSYCLQHKSWVWTQRARLELISSDKNWFGTLTYGGEREVGYSEIQKMVKRWRKAGMSVRYMAVAERGKRGGRLHYHLLVHGNVTKRELEDWPHGFTYWKLIRDGDASVGKYISKYVTKEADGRVRSSLGYGLRPLKEVVATDTMQEVFKHFPLSKIIKIDNARVPRKLTKKLDTYVDPLSAEEREIFETHSQFHVVWGSQSEKEDLRNHLDAWSDRMDRDAITPPKTKRLTKTKNFKIKSFVVPSNEGTEERTRLSRENVKEGGGS